MFNCIRLAEKERNFAIRILLVLLCIFGLYPQFCAMKTILMGFRWIDGNWEEEHKKNRRKIYVVEPVMESLLQASSSCDYLFVFFQSDWAIFVCRFLSKLSYCTWCWALAQNQVKSSLFKLQFKYLELMLLSKGLKMGKGGCNLPAFCQEK